MQASAIAVQDISPATAYPRFRAAVAQAQFESWLTGLAPRGRVIDLSGAGADRSAAEMVARAGHALLRVVSAGHSAEESPAESAAPPAGEPAAPPAGEPVGESAGKPADQPASAPGREPADQPASPPGREPADEPGGESVPVRVIAAGGGLDFLADNCADAVIAEDRALSLHLAAETLVGEIARVLKPGGRVLASADSLTFGMSMLARQHHWPHLVDLPHADVVLVPWPDGSITRCYGAEHLRELFTSSGFEVSWLRPRTVFAATTVSYLLERDPGSFNQLLSAELHARGDDSVGDQLIISATLAR